MLYNANGLESGQVSCGTIQETDGWQGLLSLADKLDAHNVLQARLVRQLLVIRSSGLSWAGCLLTTSIFGACSEFTLSYCCMQACDVYIARNLPVANRQDASFEATTDWLGWLLLADRLNMSRIAARCVAPLMKKMIASAVKQDVARLAQLSQPAAQVLLAVLLKGVKIAAIRNGSVASHLPFSVDWQAPENLF